MSLQQFLLVGKSFAGSPREKSPFGMRKDVRLPTFENIPRFATRQVIPVQTDFLHEKPPASAPAEAFAPAPRNPVVARRRKRSWLERMTFGLFGKPKLSEALVQGEMPLDHVRVIRNDLEDSDLEVVVNKSKKFQLRKVKVVDPVAIPEPARKPEKKKREEWNELTAKLFEIGQK